MQGRHQETQHSDQDVPVCMHHMHQMLYACWAFAEHITERLSADRLKGCLPMWFDQEAVHFHSFIYFDSLPGGSVWS